MRIGLIADTHGLVRPEVVEALAGVERILHAGDVGGRPVLKKLEVIAPIQAVFGNVDLPGDPWLEQAVHVTAEGRTIHVSHGHELGRPTPDRLLARYDAEVLVYGHAGPRRFNVRPSVAILEVTTTTLDAQIVWL
jgi:uncharacterized protein